MQFMKNNIIVKQKCVKMLSENSILTNINI